MLTRSNNTWFQVAVISLLTTLAIALTMLRPTARLYDASEGQVKLRRIGVALQIYREEYGFKPSGQRKDFVDAGLPRVLTVLAKPGFNWSLSGGLDTFRVADPNEVVQGESVSFGHLYCPKDIARALGVSDMSHYFASRGDALPLLVDGNAQTIAERLSSPILEFTVLRLNGKVEILKVKNEQNIDFCKL